MKGWFRFSPGETAVEFGSWYLAGDGKRISPQVYHGTEVHLLKGITCLMNVRDLLPMPSEVSP